MARRTLLSRPMLRWPVATLCVLLSACTSRESPPPGSAAPPPGTTQQATSGAADPTPTETAVHPAIVGQAHLAGLSGRLQARTIEALLAEPEAVLVVLRSRQRGVDHVRIHRVPHGSTPGEPLNPIAEEVFPAANAHAQPPVIVALPGRGIAILHPSSTGPAEGPSLWWLQTGTDHLLGPRPVPPIDVAPSASTANPVLAALPPDHLLYCDAPDPTHRPALRCGALRVPEVRWDPPPADVQGPQGPVGSLAIADGGPHPPFLMWTEGAEDGIRAHGAILQHGEATPPHLALGPVGDLAGEPIGPMGAGAPWAGGAPIASVGADRIAHVLPRTATDPPRAGQLDPSARPVGARRQIPSWPTRTERVLLFPHGDDHVLLYDAVGREGERTLVAFTHEGIVSLDYWTPLDSPEQAAEARLGASGDGLLALVHDSEHGPGLVSILTIDRMFERREPGPAAAAAAAERLRLHAEEKDRFADPDIQPSTATHADPTED